MPARKLHSSNLVYSRFLVGNHAHLWAFAFRSIQKNGQMDIPIARFCYGRKKISFHYLHLSVMYDVVIAYRIYPQVSKQPLVFADDKLRLSELCLASLQRALGELRVKVYALLDNCPPEYEALFHKYFAEKDVEVLYFREDGGNGATFNKQIGLLSAQRDAEFVYFAEDDYLYRPNQFAAMLDFMRSTPSADFVTPYDHSDYYSSELHNHAILVRSVGAYHWQKRNSTCLTFLARASSLQESVDVFESFAQRNFDASLWLSLTKYRVWNPFAIIKYLREDRFLLKVLAKAWYFNAVQIVFGRRYELWSPVPSIGTHLQYDGIAPGVDWKGEIEAIVQLMDEDEIEKK
jgi:hypothetical protein